MEETPGYYSKLLRRFVGPPGREIDFVGRFENLVGDLQLALTLAGEDVDVHRLSQVPPVNQSDYSKHPASYTPQLRRRLLESEAEVMERFYQQAHHVD